jgi:type I site-specific restriction endonuclease
MITLRDYQEDIASRAVSVIETHGMVYLSMEVRTGKTLTSLAICQRLGASQVLFLTKKKAISSIEGDYKLLAPDYDITVINYESLHKLPKTKWDIIVCDEAHGMGAFPKPSKRAKQVRDLFFSTRAKAILLSGTPTPESYSQIYHQIYGIPGNPFEKYKNFYRWADDYVNVTLKYLGYAQVKDYSGAISTKVLGAIKPFTISYTQKQAGFESSIDEEIVTIDISEDIHRVVRRLKRDFVVEGSEEVILADTGAKMMQKCHQLYSGTIIFESGKTAILDTSKAEWIKKTFPDKKIGIFYKFKAEYDAIVQVLGKENVTQDIEEFNTKSQYIALQIVSCREGISLRNAEFLVFYNIDFSATSYWQARDRMTTKDRQFNKVYWLFSRGGIEKDIYKAVTKKKDYTLRHFKLDHLSL